LVAGAKFLVAVTKNFFVVPNFVAVTKPIFFRVRVNDKLLKYVTDSQEKEDLLVT